MNGFKFKREIIQPKERDSIAELALNRQKQGKIEIEKLKGIQIPKSSHAQKEDLEMQLRSCDLNFNYQRLVLRCSIKSGIIYFMAYCEMEMIALKSERVFRTKYENENEKNKNKKGPTSQFASLASESNSHIIG